MTGQIGMRVLRVPTRSVRATDRPPRRAGLAGDVEPADPEQPEDEQRHRRVVGALGVSVGVGDVGADQGEFYLQASNSAVVSLASVSVRLPFTSPSRSLGTQFRDDNYSCYSPAVQTSLFIAERAIRRTSRRH